jgi:hypothetical protein
VTIDEERSSNVPMSQRIAQFFQKLSSCTLKTARDFMAVEFLDISVDGPFSKGFLKFRAGKSNGKLKN